MNKKTINLQIEKEKNSSQASPGSISNLVFGKFKVKRGSVHRNLMKMINSANSSESR